MKPVVIAISFLATTFLATTNVVQAQDIAAGDAIFLRKCDRCHSIGEGARHKIGPQLNGLECRRAGTIQDYDYTDANKAAGITWTNASFREYIMDPRAKVPGTRMIFSGVTNEQEIANLWGYLRQFAADGKIKEARTAAPAVCGRATP